jgi:hypothetical protein
VHITGAAVNTDYCVISVSQDETANYPVSFSSLTPTVCRVSGSTVHLVAAGKCTIEAMQVGNANYNAATRVDRSFQRRRSGRTR